MSDTLRIEFNEAEQQETLDVAASFSVDGGCVVIRGHWSGMDELWSDGCSVRIPPRVWALALPWLTERLVTSAVGNSQVRDNG